MFSLRHLCMCVLLGGCSAVNTVGGNVDPESLRFDVAQLTGPAPSANVTPMESALLCVAEHGRNNRSLRVAVSDITDGTGSRNLAGDSSSLLTQRPDLMFTVGLAKTGVRVINRSSTRVAEWEMGQAMERRLGDGSSTFVDGTEYEYRPITAGGILGSTHYVTGALTEVNWNISSSTAEAGLFGFATGARIFYISVAADLIVTDTRTTEVVMARSYQKQIVGREINAGTFRFFDIDQGELGPVELFDLSIGDQQNEPVQRAVRWLIELAAYDIAATLTHTNDECDNLVNVEPADVAFVEAAEVAAVVPQSAGTVRSDRAAVGDLSEAVPTETTPQAASQAQTNVAAVVVDGGGAGAGSDTVSGTAVTRNMAPSDMLADLSGTGLDVDDIMRLATGSSEPLADAR